MRSRTWLQIAQNLSFAEAKDAKAIALQKRITFSVEIAFDNDLEPVDWALEVSYEGSYELDEATLADGSILDDHFSAMGGWIASTLVRLGDLKLDFLPADEEG